MISSFLFSFHINISQLRSAKEHSVGQTNASVAPHSAGAIPPTTRCAPVRSILPSDARSRCASQYLTSRDRPLWTLDHSKVHDRPSMRKEDVKSRDVEKRPTSPKFQMKPRKVKVLGLSVEVKYPKFLESPDRKWISASVHGPQEPPLFGRSDHACKSVSSTERPQAPAAAEDHSPEKWKKTPWPNVAQMFLLVEKTRPSDQSNIFCNMTISIHDVYILHS